jgi:hypothetical protein
MTDLILNPLYEQEKDLVDKWINLDLSHLDVEQVQVSRTIFLDLPESERAKPNLDPIPPSLGSGESGALQDPHVERLQMLLSIAQKVTSPHSSYSLEEISELLIDLGTNLRLVDVETKSLGGEPLEHPAGIGDELGNVQMIQTKKFRYDHETLRSLGNELSYLASKYLSRQRILDQSCERFEQDCRDFDDWELVEIAYDTSLKEALARAKFEAHKQERYYENRIRRLEAKIYNLSQKPFLVTSWCKSCGSVESFEADPSCFDRTSNLGNSSKNQSRKLADEQSEDSKTFSTLTSAITFNFK